MFKKTRTCQTKLKEYIRKIGIFVSCCRMIRIIPKNQNIVDARENSQENWNRNYEYKQYEIIIIIKKTNEITLFRYDFVCPLSDITIEFNENPVVTKEERIIIEKTFFQIFREKQLFQHR